MIKAITSKQQKVLNYYKSYILMQGHAPTYQEAADEIGVSKSVVYDHVKKLEKNGYLAISKDGAIQVVGESSNIPVLGAVACGDPIEVIEDVEEHIEVPKSMLKGSGAFYALYARGESMINAGISDGDVLLIRKQDRVENGDIGIVVMDGGFSEKATLKRLYLSAKSMILKPENDNLPTQVVKQGEVRGKLVGVIRNYD